MDLPVQNSGEGRYRSVLSDDVSHAIRKLGDPRIDHAAESSRALDDDHRSAFLHGARYFFGKHDVVVFPASELYFAPLSIIRCIRRDRFLVDCREHIHEIHPGLDIVSDIGRGHQLPFRVEQIAGSRLGRAVLRGIFILIPVIVRKSLCLDADPSVSKDIETADPLAGSRQYALYAVGHLLILEEKSLDILLNILPGQTHSAAVGSPARQCGAAQHDIFPAVDKAADLLKESAVFQKRQKDLRGNIGCIPILCCPGRELLLCIDRSQIHQLFRSEGRLHDVNLAEPAVKIRCDHPHNHTLLAHIQIVCLIIPYSRLPLWIICAACRKTAQKNG